MSRVASCCASRRIALVIDEDHIELGAAEIGQAGGRGERQIAEFGMGVVDDIERDFDRRLGGLAGGSGIAGERPQNADLYGIGGATAGAKPNAATTMASATRIAISDSLLTVSSRRIFRAPAASRLSGAALSPNVIEVRGHGMDARPTCQPRLA